MATTKQDLIDRIAESTGTKRILVKTVVQDFFDEIIAELAKGIRSTQCQPGLGMESRSRLVITCKSQKSSMTRSLPQTRVILPQKLPQSHSVAGPRGRPRDDKLFIMKIL